MLKSNYFNHKFRLLIRAKIQWFGSFLWKLHECFLLLQCCRRPQTSLYWLARVCCPTTKFGHNCKNFHWQTDFESSLDDLDVLIQFLQMILQLKFKRYILSSHSNVLKIDFFHFVCIVKVSSSYRLEEDPWSIFEISPPCSTDNYFKCRIGLKHEGTIKLWFYQGRRNITSDETSVLWSG